MTIEQVQILIVEDNPDTLEMLQRKVAALGHAVYCAVDVSSAIARVEKQRIDIILTDYKMPSLADWT
jgi:CheY-like chemotaxis protein